jgi:hypothetical protein
MFHDFFPSNYASWLKQAFGNGRHLVDLVKILCTGFYVENVKTYHFAAAVRPPSILTPVR